MRVASTRSARLTGERLSDADELETNHHAIGFGAHLDDQEAAAVRAYESVFSGDQAPLLNKFDAEDLYVGGLASVRYPEAFRTHSPLLVASPDVFVKTRFG